ncbi:hypothetical protein ABCS02_25630 [Microbacterium sp. X-17]|uniref:hypothetical protein n=1 Tax=Microbacterium sp. X-17 TaxID=3144404 RepID=UPI0031F598AB
MQISKLLATATIVAVGTVGLSACAGSSSGGSTSSPTPTAIGGNLIAPVTMSANDLQGATVKLLVGQVLNINTGSLATDSYSGTVADIHVAAFTAGYTKDGATFNPGVTGIAPGTTTVTMTNANGGIQPLQFTVVVSAKQ